MRSVLFSHRSTGQADPRRERVARPPGPERRELDQQQALLLAVLRRAGGAPVTYAELKAAGVEFPAGIVSELELAGVAVERCFARGRGSRRQVGVRLARAADPDPEPVDAASASPPIPDVPRRNDWEPVRLYRAGVTWTLVEGALAGASRLIATGPGWARRSATAGAAIGGRMLAPVALLLAVGAVAVVVLSTLPGGGGPSARSARARHHAATITRGQALASRAAVGAIAMKAARTSIPSTSTGSTSTKSTATTSTAVKSTAVKSTATTSPPAPATPATQPSPEPASTALAAALDSHGHDLMVAEQYDRAVRVLERTLQATGEKSSACVEPSTQACLTYAFALYDLGRSLRLAGDPAAAVPVLEQRLRIDNQRQVVAAELAQARQQAGRRSH